MRCCKNLLILLRHILTSSSGLILWNIYKSLPLYMASHPKRHYSSWAAIFDLYTCCDNVIHLAWLFVMYLQILMPNVFHWVPLYFTRNSPINYFKLLSSCTNTMTFLKAQVHIKSGFLISPYVTNLFHPPQSLKQQRGSHVQHQQVKLQKVILIL
jgi:hypothetical protein